MTSATLDESAASCCSVNWTGEATIESISRLREDLANALSQSKNVVVCLRDVTRIDAAALQLLVATRTSLTALGRVLRLGNMSAAAEEAMRLSGFDVLVGSAQGE